MGASSIPGSSIWTGRLFWTTAASARAQATSPAWTGSSGCFWPSSSSSRAPARLPISPPSTRQCRCNIDTDLNFTQICSLALFADRVGFDDIQRHTLEGNFLNMNNISYWGISQSKKQKLVKEVFGFTCPIVQEEDVGYIKQELQERQERIDALVKTARTYEERAKEFLAGELAASLSQSERTALEKSLEALDGELASADDETLLQETIDAMAGRLCALYRCEKRIVRPGVRRRFRRRNPPPMRMRR